MFIQQRACQKVPYSAYKKAQPKLCLIKSKELLKSTSPEFPSPVLWPVLPDAHPDSQQWHDLHVPAENGH